ncbi:DUF421 domain-containing protein [Alicyclobacillus macrosporangiidus]|uniref:Uncharacterized membrane protein YcaP, DUF421 family n=1 Tax=Alicyclobacillus macrosporangiidus TaxID=392015 RepID=A0A1I7J063_9BACL|nr:DUF421 domain-containing protein [Alicyclobacillus macrosporangiidus]SFU78573.1 Uncharacterized membrane protein YcaP, DUF421 family [Alicyclobacillus macrosporangiidus]
MLEIPIWRFCLRILILYIAVMIALRLMGKREIGQLSVFDFVVSIMIAELTAVPMEDARRPLWIPLLAMGILVALQLLVAVGQLKSHRFRHWVDGEPTVLVEHGQIRDREMRKTRYTVNDLLMQLREQGIADVADVELAILETSGKLSVLPKAEARPVRPDDLGIRAHPEGIPLPLVSDGQVVKRTLQQLGRDEAWLREELHRRGCARLEDVFYASIDEHGSLFIDAVDGTSAVFRGDPSDAKRSDAERHPPNQGR